MTLGCTKDPVGKGKRLIISDAMTERGPVNGVLWIFPADSKKRKRATNEEGDSVSGSGPGDTKKKKRRKKEPTNNKDLKDEEREDRTEEGFSFVTDCHDSMNAANFEASILR